MSELVEVKTIGEVERIVHASGLWDGTGPVEFSDDGQTWTEAWAPSVLRVSETVEMASIHPVYARVTVYRKDVRIPTQVTIRWDEQRPLEREDWAEKWDRAPMRHFGRTARMVGYRQTFRDLLGDIVIEDEDRASAPPTVDPATRDWGAEFAAAQTVKDLDAIGKEARDARVFKPNAEGTALHRAWKARRAAIIGAEWNPPAAPDLSSDELNDVAATPAPKVTPLTIPHTPKPAEKRRPRRAQSAPRETATAAALRDAVLKVTNGDRT